MTAPIELHPPSVRWADDFSRTAQWIEGLMGEGARLEHVGSTAVAGLSAKPIIDVLFGVVNGADLGALAERLERHGFMRGAPAGLPQNNAYLSRPPLGGLPEINLHITSLGSPQWEHLLRFRDRLRADPSLAARYEDLKHQLAERAPDLETYTAGKSAFVADTLGTPS